jgi:hypothetical protein
LLEDLSHLDNLAVHLGREMAEMRRRKRRIN